MYEDQPDQPRFQMTMERPPPQPPEPPEWSYQSGLDLANVQNAELAAQKALDKGEIDEAGYQEHMANIRPRKQRLLASKQAFEAQQQQQAQQQAMQAAALQESINGVHKKTQAQNFSEQVATFVDHEGRVGHFIPDHKGDMKLLEMPEPDLRALAEEHVGAALAHLAETQQAEAPVNGEQPQGTIGSLPQLKEQSAQTGRSIPLEQFGEAARHTMTIKEGGRTRTVDFQKDAQGNWTGGEDPIGEQRLAQQQARLRGEGQSMPGELTQQKLDSFRQTAMRSAGPMPQDPHRQLAWMNHVNHLTQQMAANHNNQNEHMRREVSKQLEARRVEGARSAEHQRQEQSKEAETQRKAQEKTQDAQRKEEQLRQQRADKLYMTAANAVDKEHQSQQKAQQKTAGGEDNKADPSSAAAGAVKGSLSPQEREEKIQEWINSHQKVVHGNEEKDRPLAERLPTAAPEKGGEQSRQTLLDLEKKWAPLNAKDVPIPDEWREAHGRAMQLVGEHGHWSAMPPERRKEYAAALDKMQRIMKAHGI